MITKIKADSSAKFTSDWITTEDVCQLLSVTDRTVANYLQEGVLKASKIGRRNYFKFSDIMKKLEENYGSSFDMEGGSYES